MNNPYYEVTLIPLKGMEFYAEKIKKYMTDIAKDIICNIVIVDLPRFNTGDGKAVLQESVRGKDVYILVDVGNYGCEYKMYNHVNCMSPDEHFHDLVRTISAIGGKAERINVISPLLYGARQDRRVSRESLDCAAALQYMEHLGVANVMAFDVHDDRVQNATPLMGFDKLMPTYQFIKSIYKECKDIIFDENNLVVVSPDFGGINRNYIYSNELHVDLGVFYKRRSFSKFNDGKYDIEVHKYIGPDLKDKDVLIVDDIISSGETILDTAKKIKENGAKRVYIAVTFGFFTNGIDLFNEMHNKDIFKYIFVTNATYCRPEIKLSSWYKEVDVLKYISYYIYCVNKGKSISQIMDSHKKIQNLLCRENNK